MVRVSGKIRRLLLEAGLVSPDEWNAALQKGGAVVETLLQNHSLDEAAFMATLGQAAGLAPIDLTRTTPDAPALEALNQETCRQHAILPITLNSKILTIAVSDPYDVLLFDDLRRLTGCQIQALLASPLAIRQMTDRIFDRGQEQVNELLDEVNEDATNAVRIEQDSAEDLDDRGAGTGDGAPAVKLINLVMLRALKEKASDIHVEPTDKSLLIRFRVDGRLYEVMRPPRGLQPAVISRLKIMSQLDIAERYAPQDGKFQIRFEGRKIDFRLSILPVVGGEKAVMRILDTGNMSLKLDSLGYEEKALTDIRESIHSPYGMLLITGPTGSGKSTTLYACVREVATSEINVVTVEDPVEYRMDGINQVPVNPKRGLTFAGALRSILRQDPDVVLVGEIRDTETADIAIKAALTGHLVLSTLHTNDAATTVTRLIDMGVDPFMVSSSLLCVGAQRLARRLCQQCRVRIDVPEKELLKVGYKPAELEALELYNSNPGGCPSCREGFKGRFAILETLFLDNALKRMVVEGRSAQELKEEAVSKGMLSLRRVGLLNAMRGITSLAEALRVTMDEK